jgi:hypothetical protein
VTAANPSASELRAANYMADQGESHPQERGFDPGHALSFERGDESIGGKCSVGNNRRVCLVNRDCLSLEVRTDLALRCLMHWHILAVAAVPGF